jgi:hypothetical protein
MGITQNCFVNYENRVKLIKRVVHKKIGTYPLISELEEYLESIGEEIR